MRAFRSGSCRVRSDNKCDTHIFLTSSLGCSAFATMYPDGGGDGLYQSIWKPAFKAAFARWAERLRASGLQQIVSMDIQHDSDLAWLKEVTASTAHPLDYAATTVGYFPHNLRGPHYERADGTRGTWELNQILILNAWDPWSFAGNGNASDPTLDGHIGRQTAVSVLAWPVTNKYLRVPQNVVEVEVFGGVVAAAAPSVSASVVGRSWGRGGPASGATGGPASLGRGQEAGFMPAQPTPSASGSSFDSAVGGPSVVVEAEAEQRQLFECPIGLTFLSNPVLAEDGVVYEKAELDHYFSLTQGHPGYSLNHERGRRGGGRVEEPDKLGKVRSPVKNELIR